MIRDIFSVMLFGAWFIGSILLALRGLIELDESMVWGVLLCICAFVICSVGIAIMFPSRRD